MSQPLPVLPGGEDVTLELHGQGDRCVLELVVEVRKRGKAKQVLTTGHRGHCIAMLRQPQLPSYIELVTKKLVEQLGSK